MTTVEEFVEVIEKQLIDHNMSAAEMCRQSGTSERAWHMFKKAERTPNLKTMVKLFNVFNLQLAVVMFRDPTEDELASMKEADNES